MSIGVRLQREQSQRWSFFTGCLFPASFHHYWFWKVSFARRVAPMVTSLAAVNELLTWVLHWNTPAWSNTHGSKHTQQSNVWSVRFISTWAPPGRCNHRRILLNFKSIACFDWPIIIYTQSIQYVLKQFQRLFCSGSFTCCIAPMVQCIIFCARCASHQNRWVDGNYERLFQCWVWSDIAILVLCCCITSSAYGHNCFIFTIFCGCWTILGHTVVQSREIHSSQFNSWPWWEVDKSIKLWQKCRIFLPWSPISLEFGQFVYYILH